MTEVAPDDQKPMRKRPKPGERRLQILQALADMLKEPKVDRVTTAALAANIGVSEAALYRHFASKAQMFEGLLDLIEQVCLGDLRAVRQQELRPAQQVSAMVLSYLQFAQANPGLARIVVGDALVLEHERLERRMQALFDKLELNIKDVLYPWYSSLGAASPTVQAQATASLLTAYTIGQIQRYVRSGFKRHALEHAETVLKQVFVA